MRITWTELGKPTKPGPVSTRHGQVNVKQRNIETAAAEDGDCEFEMIDVSSHDHANQWILGLARRTDEQHQASQRNAP